VSVRLLHLIPNLLSGGAQQQLSYLATEQARAGDDVHVAYLHAGPKLPLFEASGAVLHRLSAHFNSDPGLLARIYRLVRDVNPDLVQTWLLQMDVAGGIASLLRGTPWILSERVSEDHWARLVSAKVALRRAVARRADAIVSNSRAGDVYWESRAGTRPVRRIIPNALPIGRIDAAARRADLRAGLEPGRKVILYAGRLSPEKNIEGLTAGLGVVSRRLPVTAFLCGDGTHEAQARTLVAKLTSSDVRIVGYSDDVWSWMKEADVFVSVSHAEGHPNTVLEAAACGCPLVLSDIPSHRDVFTEDEAVFVDRRSPPAIAAGLETVLRDPEGARVRAAAARGKVASLSVDGMARSYGELYRDVLERRAGRVR
jgi:glycosyltransferase involved in cell wall biosynthesis